MLTVKIWASVLLLIAHVFAALDSGIVATKFDRLIDLTTQVVQVHFIISFKNEGSTEVRHVQLGAEKLGDGKPAYFSASTKGKAHQLTATEEAVHDATKQGLGNFYNVKLLKALKPGQTVTIEALAVYTHAQIPFPRSISQQDNQYMRFAGSRTVLSPYPVQTQTTLVRTGSGFESFSPQEDTQSAGIKLTIGPLTNVKPFTLEPFDGHYMNNSPFLLISEMTREVTISHWTRIHVDEIVKLKHDGALLKGTFSRVDWMKAGKSAPAAVANWIARLPTGTKDFDYRDDIGNVTTSAIAKKQDAIELKLWSRFPLFGGWITDYMLNYTLPLSRTLYSKGTSYQVRLPLAYKVTQDMVVDKLTLRVVLPEGARNIRVESPILLDAESRDVKYSFLDTVGRPVVVLIKRNFVENHIADLVVSYDLDNIIHLQKPLVVVAAFLLVLFLTILYQRLDFSLDPAAPVVPAATSKTEK